LALAAVVVLAAAIAAPAAAAPAVSGEFDVPGLGTGNKLVQGPEGNIWVTTGGGGGKEVARITPSGEVEEFEIEAVTPAGITVGPENRIWVARNGGVVSFVPADPPGTKDVTDIGDVGNEPSIVLGPDGNLWATGDEKVVRIPPSNPAAATAVSVPGMKDAKDIDIAGSLIVVAAREHIYAVTTDGAVVGDQPVSGQAQGVGGNPNGQYAFTQPVTPPKEIGLLAPGVSPVIRSAEGTDPFGITLGADGAYWSPEFISDGLTRIAADGTVSGIVGFATGSGPRQITAGPDNTLWVTLEMTKKVGRVSGLEPPVIEPPTTPDPRTQLKAGPKGALKTRKKTARVRFKFRSPDPGATFQCRLKRLPAKKKAKSSKASKQAKWGGCKSPRKYRLGPGRYRFEVRAVLAGVTDKTPAKRVFRIVRVRGK
jgi:streptogramin lyase